jgi:gliding motility-associated-like protein
LVRKLRLLLILPVFAVFTGYAQVPVAGITALPLTGCAPLAVSFSDNSTNSPTSWSWTFGTAPNVSPVSSASKNAAALFNVAGTYVVTHTATNASGTSVPVTVTITVYPVPVANFNVDKTTGCYPTTVNFTNISDPGTGATIVSWIWDFGDGNLDSTNYNPSHFYHTGGTIPIILAVKNNFGCNGKAQVKTVSGAITLTNGVFPDFSTAVNTNCVLPVSATFTNQTVGPPVLSYTWDFGDGSPLDPTTSPTHNFAAAGAYTVKLAAVSSQGCTDTLKSVVNISASGNLSDFTGAGNVCINSATNFINTSSPSPSSATWNYGDGSPIDNAINGNHTYTIPGVYHVLLTNTFGSCTGSITKDVTVVSPATVAFTATNVSSCKPPLTTQFTDQTVGATIWSWNFGDGTPFSNLQNPSHTYTSTGSFQVTLTAGTAAGCSNALTKTAFVNISAPIVSITNAPAYGCAPFVYTPTYSATAVDGVATYAWDFGNGVLFNGQVPPPQTYPAGVYNVTLTITTNGGCQATATGVVKVGTIQPVPLFTAVPTAQCVGQPIQFTDMSTGAPNQWFWDFGDGSTSPVQNPNYSYTKPGTFDVTLTAYNNGCSQKLTKTAYITIKPPLADFKYTFACGAQTNFTFTDNSTGATTWDWDFGDMTPHGNTSTVTHNYATAVDTVFNVTLTVTNGTCSNSITKQVNVNQVTTVSTPVNPVCNNTLITIFATAPGNIVGFLFDFGDGSPLAGSGSGATSHTYTTPGNYNITVTTTDNNGCVQTSAPYVMHVSGPTVQFTTPTLVSCGPLAATFTDQSTPAPGTTLKSWAWDFGDGATGTGQAPGVHNYNFQGIFPVKLKVTDNNGCTDSLIKPNYITVSTPVASFITNDSEYCPSSVIRFINASTGGFNPVYTWDFKDGTMFTGTNPPLHNFPLVNTYAVSVSILDADGCTSSFSKTITIDVPVASFTMTTNYSACPPLNELFTFTGHYARTYTWNFDNGGSSTLQNPSSIYALPGDYDPKLTIVSPGGCIASFTDHIHIDGPIGALTYSPLTACDSLSVNFQVTTSNAISFTWNFNDGTQITTPTPSTTHLYNIPGSYSPFVTLVDAAGCKVTTFGTDQIEIDSIAKTAFTVDKSSLCDNGTINFTSTTVVATGTTITNYIWDFGDGSPTVTGLNTTTSHFYGVAGVFNASLNITTQGGCSGFYTIPITIAASPQVAINGLISQCAPAVLTFSGVELVTDPNGPLTWSWDFGNQQTGTGQNPAPVSYPKQGEYVVRLIATNTKGCSDTTDTSTPQHLFIYPVPSVNAGADTTICLGSPLQLNASGAATTYNWQVPVNGTLSCYACVNPIATTPVSTYFVVNGSSPQGCAANDTIQVTVNTPVTVNISGPDSVCLGQSVQLTATGAAIYTWTPAEGLNNPNIGNPMAKPDASQIGTAPSAVITYQVTGSDNKACFTDTKSVDVTVFNYPVLTVGPDATINVGGTYQINATASTNVVSLVWTPSGSLSCASCLTPIAQPVKTTKYVLTATNDGGCTTSDSIRIQVVCNNSNFFVPNTFSPNGDGVNDHFIVNGTGLNVIPSITIYNRWGQIVFQKSNFAPNTVADAWDGTFNGQPAPADVYIYTIQILCDNATLISYHGNVTLIR